MPAKALDLYIPVYFFPLEFPIHPPRSRSLSGRMCVLWYQHRLPWGSQVRSGAQKMRGELQSQLQGALPPDAFSAQWGLHCHLIRAWVGRPAVQPRAKPVIRDALLLQTHMPEKPSRRSLSFGLHVLHPGGAFCQQRVQLPGWTGIMWRTGGQHFRCLLTFLDPPRII